MRALTRQLLTNRRAGSIALVGLVTVLVLAWSVADLGGTEAAGRRATDDSSLSLAHDAANPGLHAVRPSSPARTRTVVMIALLLVIAACSIRRLRAGRRPDDAAFALASVALATAGPRAPPASF